jgi:hypothetical protein
MDLYDMELGSNDTNVLKLHDSTDPKSYFLPKKTIMDHYIKEFNRLLKGTMPFYNSDEGASERFGEALRKSKTIDQALSEYNSQEESRRKALYGDGPGLLKCRIRVKRHQFPVLFEIKIHISADKYLRHNQPSLLTVEDVGYGTPENIEAEIKKAITAQLQLLSENSGYVRNCSTGK